MTKLKLLIELDIGETSEGSCGDCPFNVIDWNLGEPDGTSLCTNPAWDPITTTYGNKRHEQCVKAEVK